MQLSLDSELSLFIRGTETTRLPLQNSSRPAVFLLWAEVEFSFLINHSTCCIENF